MLYPLLLLLKKDILLAVRNRVWTAFEVLLPAALLLLTAYGAYEAKGIVTGETSFDDHIEILPSEDMWSQMYKANVEGCSSDYDALLTGDTNGYNDPFSSTQVSTKDEMVEEITERVDECKDEYDDRHGGGSSGSGRFLNSKIGVSIDDITSTSVSYTLFVPISRTPSFDDSANLRKFEWSAEDKFSFVELQKHIDQKITEGIFHVNSRTSINFETLEGIVQLQGYKKYIFYLSSLISFCLLLSVINITRNVVTEKSSVKPYLAAMGLPGWMFYLEHFIGANVKTIVIVPVSMIMWIIVLEEVNAAILIFGTLMFAFGSNSFALLMGSFFKTAKRATEVTIIFWIFLTVIVFIFKIQGVMTVICSFNIVHAYYFYFDAITVHLLRDKELTFGTLFSSEDARQYPCGVYLIMIVIDTAWMFGAAILVDKYKAKIDSIGYINFFKKIGQSIARKLPSRYRSENDSSNTRDSESNTSETSAFLERETILAHCAQNEKNRDDAVADIDLKKLVKIYPTGEKAVNGLTLRAIRGQVSVLLGHNGCGKSTTFSMISGINLPTDGSIEIGGVDAIEDRATARSFIGLCPQYNPIYEKLTVMEHLALVNALKGGSRREGRQEALELLTDIGLIEKKNTLAGKLSGGMKRKLCVCMAMINNSRVILLDEPTAGMDPGARKDVQRMLEKVKKDRTILLTTHYMDEAERLGDWIFVMSHGKMAASGTSAFLKKQLGSGFLLTIVLENEGDKTEVYKLVEIVCKSYIGNAKVKDVRGQMMEFTIPEGAKFKVLGLLEALEAIKENRLDDSVLSSIPSDTKSKLTHVKIVTMGLALDSLEQVFIKIGEECKKIVAAETKTGIVNEKSESYKQLMEMKQQPKKTGIVLNASQFVALLKKRARYSIRNYQQYFNQLVIPIILLILVCHALTKLADRTSMDMSLSSFPPSVVYIQCPNEKIEDYLRGFENLMVEKTEETDMFTLVMKHYSKIPSLGFVVECTSNSLTVRYNSQVTYARIPLMNAISNMLLIMDGSENKRIHTTLEFVLPSEMAAMNKVDLALGVGILSTFLLAMITSPFVLFLIEERVSKYTHQQLLTGLSHFIYWSANVVFDLMFFFVVAVFVLGISMAYGAYQLDNFLILIVMFMLYFYALIPIIYTTSCVIAGPAKASILLLIYQIVFSLICVITIIMVRFLAKDMLDTTRMFSYLFVPTSAFMESMMKIAIGSEFGSFLDFDELYSWKGIVSAIFFLCFGGTMFLVIFLLAQVRGVRQILFIIFHGKQKTRPRAQTRVKPCPAVFAEEEIARRPNIQKTTVVLLKDLVRDFKRYRAVNGICLTVRKNECFGMLGTNGAGKTTTFDILTGLRFPSGGAAYVDGKSVSKSTNIGYCPQFDAILQEFTGKEALELIAQLHGYQQVKLIVQHVLNCVGMTEHAHKKVRYCSGGQKRKISVGIALLSSSHCVILDEPTAGIDPDARRDIWETLVWLREKSGCSIVLTSHSMEECEALCSRIAILKKGEVIALGTSQDLKSQYGCSYSLTLVMRRIEDRKKFCTEVRSRIAGSVLKTAETNKTLSMNWEIPKKADDKWSKKFAEARDLAADLKAADFMLAESSLEDTFIYLTSD